jgi:hypothetical protein
MSRRKLPGHARGLRREGLVAVQLEVSEADGRGDEVALIDLWPGDLDGERLPASLLEADLESEAFGAGVAEQRLALGIYVTGV